MLIFTEQALAFIAVPKTGTTALEIAMRNLADIRFGRSRKHTTAANYTKHVAPFLKQTYGVEPERFAVMRDPVDQIRSWYKYRRRDLIDGSEKSSKGVTFDEFVSLMIGPNPPPFARIGQQHRMLTHRNDLMVDHLFAYEHLPLLHAFLAERFEAPIDIKPRNVSPVMKAPLDASLLQDLKAARPQDFELYERLRDSGGYLRPEG